MKKLKYLIKLLEFRGFLIDSGQQGYSLSDNGHVKDAAYLDELLQKYDIYKVNKAAEFLYKLLLPEYPLLML